MKNILYLGTDPHSYKAEGNLVHCPVIQIVPRELNEEIQTAFQQFGLFTHIIYTSKHSVQLTQQFMKEFNLEYVDKTLLAIGLSTACAVVGIATLAEEPTQEGMIRLLDTLNLQDAYVFFPKSSLAREDLQNYLVSRNIRHLICNLYDTLPNGLEALPQIDLFDEIVFTSPSTVHAFIKIFGAIPFDKQITAIGPITQKAIDCIKRIAAVSSEH
jgi:uroporphyrinogen-III synthase